MEQSVCDILRYAMYLRVSRRHLRVKEEMVGEKGLQRDVQIGLPFQVGVK
jgi:hypothetical protein